MTDPDFVSPYPDGYHDPEFDGSVDDFRVRVIPARMEAIAASLTAQLAEMGYPDLSVGWVQDGP